MFYFSEPDYIPDKEAQNKRFDGSNENLIDQNERIKPITKPGLTSNVVDEEDINDDITIRNNEKSIVTELSDNTCKTNTGHETVHGLLKNNKNIDTQFSQSKDCAN